MACKGQVLFLQYNADDVLLVGGTGHERRQGGSLGRGHSLCTAGRQEEHEVYTVSGEISHKSEIVWGHREVKRKGRGGGG